jgi:serine/threonine protein kinase
VREDGIIYRYVRELGRGNFGVVYLYSDDTKTKNIALKIEFPSINGKHSAFTVGKESFHLRNLMSRGLRRVPKYYGDGFHNSR